jgi:hypothetical protein
MRTAVLILGLIMITCTGSYGQSQLQLPPVDTSAKSVAYWQNWMSELNEQGVEKKNDSLYVRQEVVKLMKDPEYRKTVYPEVYNWEATVAFMKSMELKKAFWQLINLYQTDTARRNIVVGTFILYDSLIDMDKILLSTFYTYAFTDPEACRILNNKPEIVRPDILEKKLRTTRELVNYIWINRKNKAEKKQ